MSPLLKFLLMIALEGLCVYRLRYLFRRTKIKYGEIISVEKKMVTPVFGKPQELHNVLVQYTDEEGNEATTTIDGVSTKFVVGGKIDLDIYQRNNEVRRVSTNEIVSLIVVMIFIFLNWIIN
jgi:hypothetical protein